MRIVLRLRQKLGEVDRTWRNVPALRNKLRPLVLDRDVLDAEIFMGAQQGPEVTSSLRLQSSRPDPPATLPPFWKKLHVRVELVAPTWSVPLSPSKSEAAVVHT